jgi:hypothetical protein
MLLVPSDESFSETVVFRFPSSDPPRTRIRKRTQKVIKVMLGIWEKHFSRRTGQYSTA